jgi:hypothetical protein
MRVWRLLFRNRAGEGGLRMGVAERPSFLGVNERLVILDSWIMGEMQSLD